MDKSNNNSNSNSNFSFNGLNENNDNESEPEHKSKRNMIIIIISLSLLIIGIAIAAIIALKSNDNDTKKSKNHGFVFTNDDEDLDLTNTNNDINTNSNENSSNKSISVDVNGTTISYNTTNLINSDTTINEGEFTSTKDKETVFLVTNGTLILGQGVKIKKNDSNNTKRRLDISTQLDKPNEESKKNNSGINSTQFPSEQIQQYNNNSNHLSEAPRQQSNINSTNSPSSSSGGQGTGIISESDSYNFYGINSAIVVVGPNAKAIINGVTITTNSYGSNAVVALNSGKIEIKDSIISTQKNSSRGIHATYKGIIIANNITISTKGDSCANIATDIGKGTIFATNMNLLAFGDGSPLIYSTGNISVINSTGSSIGSQIAVVEGKNNVTLNNCKFSCGGNRNKGDTDIGGIILYQSNSGRFDVGQGSFNSLNSSLNILNNSSYYSKAPMFFVTNTKTTITLNNTNISFGSNMLLNVRGTDQWGSTGSNGGVVDLIVTQKTIKGILYADNISSITFKYDSNVNSSDYSYEGNVTTTSIL